MKFTLFGSIICLIVPFLTNCGARETRPDPAAVTLKTDTLLMVKHAPWIAQSNVYEVNVRQYTKEGTFRAFEKHLPRLKEMGVEILWFMPVTPISKTDRKGTLGSYYAVADYRSINPEFGTMEDFKALVNKAHEMGFKVITDWVPNHTGADHAWLTSNPNFYHTDSTGKARYAFDWSDTRELNYDNMAMRDSMLDAMQFWIRETNIDGFRVDVAGEVPTDFWQDCIPRLRAMKDLFLLAEADKPELHRAGFNVSYPWEFFQIIKQIAAGTRGIAAIDSLIQRQDSAFPANAFRLYFTSNHDENSWNKSDYGTFTAQQHASFAILTQTLGRSVPLVYSGQEEPVKRAISFFEKDNINFRFYGRGKFYKTLLQLRRQNPGLAADAPFKRIKAGSDSAIYAYARGSGSNRVVVVLNFSPKAQQVQVSDSLMIGEPANVFLRTKEKLSAGHKFGIEPWGYIIYDYSK